MEKAHSPSLLAQESENTVLSEIFHVISER